MNSIDDFTTKFIWVVLGIIVLVFYIKNRDDDDYGE
jgi:hypothetical protein